MNSQQEKFEDTEKMTNDYVSAYMQDKVQTLGATLGQVMQFSLNMLSTQTRELTLLREFEALAREASDLPSWNEADLNIRLAEIANRTNLILSQLTLFRKEISERNAERSQDTPSSGT